jgi:hypothetical protein
MKNLTLLSIAFAMASFLFGQANGAKHVPEFKKVVLSETFISEGVCVGDVNQDGIKDVMAGAFWFEAPNWTKHAISDDDIRYDKSLKPFPKEHVFKVDEGYSNSFVNFAQDVNHDGWVDLIKIGLPGEAVYWFENPKNKAILWKKHFLYASVGNESPLFEDVNGDGLNDIIGNDSKSKKMIWLEAPLVKKDTIWKVHVISSNPNLGTHKYTHGLGYGDMNGDSKKDIIIKDGWWESPADLMLGEWTFHPLSLQFDSAHIMVLDLDGDGFTDLLNSSAHDYGIWWHRRTATGIETQLIQKDLSQTHAMAMADLNGDKHPDFVVGKRFMAHNGKDPGEFEKPILRWLEFKPGKTPAWMSHDIDEDSGAGIHLLLEDMNKDGLTDIIISNKKGVFVFYHQKKKGH